MKQADPADTHILVVEDDDVERETLRDALAGHGYRAQSARSGLDAFDKVRHDRYDLLLVDYNMPDIDGMATARLVRDLTPERDRPVLIALTGTPNDVTAREASYERVFDSVIAKPAKLSALTARIDRAMETVSGRAARRKPHIIRTPKPAGEPSAEPVGSASALIAKPRILLVEDDHMQRYVLWHMLEHYGNSVDTAGDGFAAVRMTRETSYDLVLMDYRLPDMDGLATARVILGSMDEEARPRVVALTTAADLLAEQEAMTGSAFDEVVAKAPDLPALLATVRRHLSHELRAPHG